MLAAEDGTFFTTNSTYNGLDWNTDLRGETLVSKRLIPLVAKLIYIRNAVGPIRTVQLHELLYIIAVQTM